MAPKSETLLRGPDGMLYPPLDPAHGQPPEDYPVQRRGRPRANTPPVRAATLQSVSRESDGHQKLTAQKNEQAMAKAMTGMLGRR